MSIDTNTDTQAQVSDKPSVVDMTQRQNCIKPSRSNIPEEHQKRILDNYLSGMSLEKSATSVDSRYNQRYTERVLSNAGLKPRTVSVSHGGASTEEKKQIVKNYLEGMTLMESGAELGYGVRAVMYALKEAGCRIRPFSEARREYAVNESFFDIIDTEDKAYWVGFISADGCITTDNGVLIGVSIGLKESDVDHLHKWKKSIGSEHPISRYNWNRFNTHGTTARVIISSKKLAEALVKIGIPTAKTHIIKPCTAIPDRLARHYWRGLVDGDGSLSKTVDTDIWCLTLSGTKDIVDGFRNFLISQGVDTECVPREQTGCWTFKLGGVSIVQKAASILWENATVYLNRKYNLYTQLASQSHNRTWDSIDRNGMLKLYNIEHSWRIVAKKMNIPEWVVWYVMDKPKKLAEDYKLGYDIVSKPYAT